MGPMIRLALNKCFEQPQFFISLRIKYEKTQTSHHWARFSVLCIVKYRTSRNLNLGTLESDKVYTVTNIVGAKPGAWQDFINFSVDEDTYLQTAVYSLSFLTMGAVDNFWLQLTDLADNSSVFDTQNIAQVENYTFSLDTGNYSFNLSGSGNDGFLPGVYTVAISPVPEAPVYALMLSGLAAMGISLRKKKNK